MMESYIDFYFHGNGTMKDNVDVQFALSGFGNQIIPFTDVGSSESTDGLLFLEVFKELQVKKAYGTHTHLIFQYLVEHKQDITQNDGEGLVVLVLSDGEPYIVGNKNVKQRLLNNAGLTSSDLGATAVGELLFKEYFARFRREFPKAIVVGMSPVAIDTPLFDDAFDLFFDSDTGVEDFITNTNYVMCGQSSDLTKAPTSPTLTPTASPTGVITSAPSKSPTMFPTRRPSTLRPTKSPTMFPTRRPSTSRPTKSPVTMRPTTLFPTRRPTTQRPSKSPTLYPTRRPSRSPTPYPTV
jgi:hypothetical protein